MAINTFQTISCNLMRDTRTIGQMSDRAFGTKQQKGSEDIDTANTKKLSQYLKELRKSHGYQQEFVASHLNITRQTYSHYETGRITPPVNSLYNLAALYGIPVGNFMEFLVTYNINSDFAKNPPSPLMQEPAADLSEFMTYINQPTHSKKFKALDHNEKLLLYYYEQLDKRDQEDMLTFLKVKYENRKQERKERM